jgi:poly-gamma-glutamate system protein
MILELNSKTRVKTPFHDDKVTAAELTARCFQTIRLATTTYNIPIDRINDPNETGLIGLQHSPITTERGDLNAKLTSANPNFAALIVDYLRAIQVRPGDTVAVSFTGSFPALNIAVLSALKVLDIQPIIITSVGSSMWGANRPAFTYLDMERTLNEHNLIPFRTHAASVGGEDDIGRGLSPEGRLSIIDAIRRNGVQALHSRNIEDAISQRMKLYDHEIKAFISVGGAITALLATDAAPGFIQPRQAKSGRGLIAEFSRAGIPVVNLTDITTLAKEHDLPIAPIPMPDIGEGKLYYEYRYSVAQAILYLIILCVVLFVFLRFDIDYYLKRR